MNDEANTAEDRTIFDIPFVNLKRFEEILAKLSRRSVKLGCGEIIPFIFGYHMKKLDDGHEHKIMEVLLTADPVKIEGWQFVATIDHSQETGNIIRSVPNHSITIPETYRNSPPACQHCNTNRYRRDSFIIHCTATGEFKQIGRNCLKDFFGHDPYTIARLAELLGYAAEAARGFENFVGGDRRYIELETYLRHCALMVRKYGWVSRSVARENDTLIATAERARCNMYPAKGYEDTVEPISDEDISMAEASITWAESLKEKEDKSDYEHNICVIANAQMIEYRSMGIAASIVGVYARNTEREIARRAEREAMKESQHIGTVGERIRNLTVTVLSHRTRESIQFGTQHTYRFVTPDGNILVWFASTDANVSTGEIITLTGTVKKHDLYDEKIKNTNITRCKVVKHD